MRYDLPMMMKRKTRRTDRNHVIYRLTVKGKTYIGLTVVENGNALKSAKRRFQKHVSRAKREDKGWKLCEMIRKHGAEAFLVEVVAVVRGKVAAHDFERDLIRTERPKLNTDIRGC